MTSPVEFVNIGIISPDCFERADADATEKGDSYDLTYEEEHEIFNTLYEACVRQNKK